MPSLCIPRLAAPLTLLLASFAAGCGGGSDGTTVTPPPPPPPPPAAVATVEVTPATATLAIGGTSQLSAVTKDASGNILSGRSVTWATSAASVATVSGSGLVAAVAAGSATITATSESRSGTAAVTVTPPPVASVVVSPDTASVLTGGTIQFRAVTRDTTGATLTGRTIMWTTSAPAVATVNASGLVATLTPGNVTITATSEGRSASGRVEVVNASRIPALVRPFAANTQYFTTNFHDHDLPRSFFDNGRKVTFWGERYNTVGYEGHEGYDWRMAEGTPILSVADGTVISLSNPPFFCPLLNVTVPQDGQGQVILEHRLPGGVVIRSFYAHLSRKDVRVGDRVTAGQQIGLSGGVGCALNPHLHLGIFRMTQTKDGTPSIIDPYGWEGPGVDPWTAESDGAESINLWRPNEAPELFTRVDLPVNTGGSNLFFGMTRVQGMGVRDNANPNNEYVEVSRDPQFAPASLNIGGVTIRTRAGTVYTFPSSAALTAVNPTIRVYSGSGTNTESVLYIGRNTEAYNNLSECVQVFTPTSLLRGRVLWGGGAC